MFNVITFSYYVFFFFITQVLSEKVAKALKLTGGSDAEETSGFKMSSCHTSTLGRKVYMTMLDLHENKKKRMLLSQETLTGLRMTSKLLLIVL